MHEFHFWREKAGVNRRVVQERGCRVRTIDGGRETGKGVSIKLVRAGPRLGLGMETLNETQMKAHLIYNAARTDIHINQKETSIDSQAKMSSNQHQSVW